MIVNTTTLFDRLALNWQPRFKVLQGGSSSGKTFAILQYLIILAMRSKTPKLVSIVSESLPHLRRGALRDFVGILGDKYDQGAHNRSEGTYRLGEWVFEFFGADNSSKLRGARRDILFINECNNVGYDAYSQLEMRTRDLVFLDYNPSSEFWVHIELIPRLGNDELFFDISTYHDNEYAPQASINAIERRKFNADGEISEFYKVYGLGQIGSLEGVIYDNWEQIDTFPEVPTTFGLDFGYTNDPTALLKVGYHNDRIYLDEYLYDYGLTNQDIAAQAAAKGVRRQDIVWADSSEPKSIAELCRAGMSVRGATKGKDSITNGIDWIKSRRIYVTKRSINTIKELRNYIWETDSDGRPINKPVDEWDHCMDAFRYGLSPRINSSRVIAKKVAF